MGGCVADVAPVAQRATAVSAQNSLERWGFSSTAQCWIEASAQDKLVWLWEAPKTASLRVRWAAHTFLEGVYVLAKRHVGGVPFGIHPRHSSSARVLLFLRAGRQVHRTQSL